MKKKLKDEGIVRYCTNDYALADRGRSFADC